MIFFFLPGHSLIAIDAFSSPSNLDTIETVTVAHTVCLPNLRGLPSSRGSSTKQPFSVPLVLFAGRDTLPNTQDLGGGGVCLQLGRRAAEGGSVSATSGWSPQAGH